MTEANSIHDVFRSFLNSPFPFLHVDLCPHRPQPEPDDQDGRRGLLQRHRRDDAAQEPGADDQHQHREDEEKGPHQGRVHP